MSLPQRLDAMIDRAPMVLMTGLLAGSALAFGGVVWWARPAILATILLLLCASGLRATRRGSWSVLKSPLLPLGVLALGLGVVQPTPSWGSMLNEARAPALLATKPWLWLAPGLTISLAVLAINFIGDGLRDAFDVRSRAAG